MMVITGSKPNKVHCEVAQGQQRLSSLHWFNLLGQKGEDWFASKCYTWHQQVLAFSSRDAIWMF
jgi:hypothetical protein